MKAYDLPQNAYAQKFSRTGAELNTIAGYALVSKDRESENFNVTLDQLAALHMQNIKNLNQQAQAKQREAAADKAGKGGAKRGTPGQFAAVEAKKAAALSKAESAYRKAIERDDPA